MGGSITKIVIGLIMVAVLLVIFPIVLSATHNMQTGVYTQLEEDISTTYTQVEEGVSTTYVHEEAGVITLELETTAEVVLDEPLYDDDKLNVLLIESTWEGDVPTADDYVPLTQTLTVGGLIAEKTRDLTIHYKYIDTALVVLDEELWDGDVDFVSITSTQDEEPTADDYDPNTGILTVGGLTAKNDRDLTIEYKCEDTASVVLDEELWNDDMDSIVSITSTEAADTPTADGYDPGTGTLIVGGLIAESDRDLTIRFEHDILVGFTGLGALTRIAPLLVWIGVLVTVVGGIWLTIKSRRA